jgi:hypothetical protein
MAWTTPLTAVANTALTAAQWNASVRDNLLTTASALATTAGQMFISTGANAIAARTPTITNIATQESFTPSTGVFADITAGTVGPVVGPVTTGTKALVMYGTYGSNASVNCGIYMSYAVSGASTIAAATTNALRLISETAGTLQRAFVMDLPTLTAGANTFTAKYTSPTGGVTTFQNRTLIVLPL